ncbi:MAG TPA: hypothetical protein PKD24_17075 [Pyrinomonadaceae bacterium]|nr:hypothetical protein [Pyrinomonadaceae bacterium]HMP66712.1 hypothetical protein [Pyrinomonadaceae bacterium]
MTETHKLSKQSAGSAPNEEPVAELPSIFAALEKISHRLDKLEAAAGHASKVSEPQRRHPSVDRFTIAEAIADELFGKLGNEKACTFEPNDKPCDHCSMCSSLGF